MESDSDYVESVEGEPVSPPNHGLSPSPPAERPTLVASLPNPSAVASKSHSKHSSASSTTKILIPSIHINPFAQAEDAKTYFARPNRYFGPASTWKSWTEAERNVVLAIDRDRSQDLSIHLLTAFVLRKRIQQSAPARSRRKRERSVKKNDKGKERAKSPTDDDIDDDRLEGYSVPKSWTAWPMPADQVPRDELLPREDGVACFRAETHPRPSAALEDSLVAIATRMARERWYSRQWEGTHEAEDPKLKVKLDHTKLETYNQNDSNAEGIQEAEESQSDPEFPMFTSQPYPESEDSSNDIAKEQDNSDEDETANLEDHRPVPLADDLQAAEFFRPSARHILSRLDDLLIGLHKARSAYAGKPKGEPRGRYSSRSATRDEFDTTGSESRSRGRSRATSASRNARRPLRNTSVAEDTDVFMASASAGARSTSRRTSDRTRQIEKLNLRDWSDMMGMASLTGWDPAVVERASERCAMLFSENMLFRTFHEGGEKSPEKPFFTEQLADMETEGHSSDEHEEDETKAMASRISQPCTHCGASRSKCIALPDEQLSGKGRPCKECVDHGLECSGIVVRWLVERVCPFESCERHSIPFRKQYHLQRHLDAAHNEQEVGTPGRSRTPLSRQMSSTSAITGASSDIDVDYKATNHDTLPHSNIIMCPVRECKRHRQPFSRGTALYKHVRTMHPEIDVATLKKLESIRRGERRGTRRNGSSASAERRPGYTPASRKRMRPTAPQTGSDDDNGIMDG